MPRVRLRSNAKGPAETLELLSGAPLCSDFIRTHESQGPAETQKKKIDVSALHHWDCNKGFNLRAGAILMGNRGVPH